MKKQIRSNTIKLRNELSEKELIYKSHKIYNHLLSLEILKPEMNVLVYMDFRNEVLTNEINEYVMNNNMTLLLPRVDKKTNTLSIHIVRDLSDLVKSKYGILEPGMDSETVDYKNIDLIIAPGVAFDENCYRLGYGGGFYDKLLSNKRNDTLVAAIAFDVQIITVVPREEHDLKVDFIVTESKIIRKENT